MKDLSLLIRGLPAASVVLASAFAVAGEWPVVQVGCNCGVRGGGVMSMAPLPEYLPPALPAEPALLPGAPAPQVVAEPVAPPPGTVGRTYEQPTHLIPADEHPRVGMLKVRVKADDVLVSHTNEFREEDDVKGFQDEADPSLWHFKTKPLLPGIPHVYKVEAINGGVTTDVRYVRLIRGRILDLSF